MLFYQRVSFLWSKHHPHVVMTSPSDPPDPPGGFHPEAPAAPAEPDFCLDADPLLSPRPEKLESEKRTLAWMDCTHMYPYYLLRPLGFSCLSED